MPFTETAKSTLLCALASRAQFERRVNSRLGQIRVAPRARRTGAARGGSANLQGFFPNISKFPPVFSKLFQRILWRFCGSSRGCSTAANRKSPFPNFLTSNCARRAVSPISRGNAGGAPVPRPSGGHVGPPFSSRANPAAAQDAGFQTRNVGSQPHFCIIDFHVSVVFWLVK
jgi:hypothetical protein